MDELQKELLFSLINFPPIIVATLIPMIIGFVWYNPKTPMGTIWIRETKMTDEKMKGSNMFLIFGLSILFSFLMNFFIVSHEVVHQWGVFSLLNESPQAAQKILIEHKNTFRTFSHGAIHGMFLGLFFVFPLFAVNGMFERRSWKLILINSAYWIVSLIIMGGIICAWQ